MRFEPAGMTTNSDIPFAKSFVDYIVRWMGMQFIPGYRAANAPKRETTPPAMEMPAPAENNDTAESTESIQGSGGDPAGREIVREAAAGHGGPSLAHEPNGGSHSNGGSHGAHAGTNGGTHGGNGGHGAGTTLLSSRAELLQEPAPAPHALNASMSRLMGDAPTCTCGSITVRNGSCYKCLNCGASLGCS